MATLTIRPNGAGVVMDWGAEGGDWQRVDESSSDGDTTRLYTPTANNVALFALENRTSELGTINSVVVYVNIRGVDPVDSTMQVAIRTNSTNYFSADKTYNNTSYHLESNTWSTNPNTSAAWTWTEVDALQAGMKFISGGAQAVTQVYVEVDYTPATLEQEGFRFRNDDGSETTATWKAAQDTNVKIMADTNTRLRVLLNATGDPSAQNYQLEFRESGGSWAALTSSALNTLLSNDFSSSIDDFTSVQGTWAISGGVLQNTASGSGGAWQDRVFLTDVTTYDDVTILVKVKKPSFNTQVVFRSGSSPNTGYGIQLRDTDVFRLENWGISNLQQATPITWSTGTWYWVKIVTLGTNIKARVWADGGSEPSTWNIDYTGSEFSSGAVGFSGESSTGTAEYDDLSIYEDGTALYMSASSNITASGQNTTALLTAPSGKSTSDFDAGRMQDDENPADSVTISSDDYTEMEWCFKATTQTYAKTYEFRVTANGAVLNTYTVTPSLSVVGEKHLTDGLSTTDATSYATSTITPGAYNFIKATFVSRTNITTNPNQPTLTGCGLTWNVVKSKVYDDSSTSRRRVTTFAAIGSSPSAGALTFDCGGQTQTTAMWTVDESIIINTTSTTYTDAIQQSKDNADTAGSATSLTVTFDSTPSVSNITYGVFGFGAVTGGATPGSGFTEIFERTDTGGENGVAITSLWKFGTDTTVDATISTTGTEIGGIAIEIKTTITSGGGSYSSTLTESVVLTDNKLFTTSRTLTQVVTLVDVVVKNPARTLTQTLTIVDTAPKNVSRLLTDSISITGLFVLVTNKILVEVVTLVDAFLRGFNRLISETIVLVDTFTSSNARLLSLVETVSIIDTKIRSITRVITENVVINDVFSTFRYLATTITNVISIADNIATIMYKELVFTEVLRIREIMWRRLVKPVAGWIKDTFGSNGFTKKTFEDSDWELERGDGSKT